MLRRGGGRGEGALPGTRRGNVRGAKSRRPRRRPEDYERAQLPLARSGCYAKLEAV